MDSPKPEANLERRLDSWKEIASYLDRGVRTVQRWERTEGLPVRRHQHDKRGTVFALPSEIDRWQQEREAGGQSANPDSEDPPRRTPRIAAAMAALALVVLAAGYNLRRPQAPTSEWTIRPVTSDHGHEHSPTISPDGTQIAYTWHEEHHQPSRIYVQDLAGGDRRRLTSGDQREYSPVWSPDGNTIAAAFLYPDEDRRAIVLITPETGACRTLLEPTVGVGSPIMAWSPDGEWLVLSVGLDDRGPGFFAYRIADGQIHEVIPPRTERTVWAPAVSPDGRSVAFAGSTSDSVSQIFVQSLDEQFRPVGEPYAVTDDSNSTSSPLWSADGREILFRRGWWADSSLWRVALRGGEPSRAAVATRGLSEVAYNAYAGSLLFTHETGASDLWLQPQCDCPERGQRLISSTLHDLNARISPDGRRIAWISDRTGLFQVWVAEADGSDPHPVTELSDTMTGTPRWSPDSRLIAFDSRPHGHSDIFVVPADGGDAHRFTTSPGADLTPEFSADGQAVYFGSDRSGEFQIWRKPLAGGPAEQVTAGGGFTAAESPDGETVFFARTGHKSGNRNSLWRISSDGGPEVRVVDEMDDWSKFLARPEGVYFVACARDDLDSCEVRILDAAEDTHMVARIPRDVGIGLDVAPDGSLLYTRYEPSAGDLMLVENFY